MRKEGLLSPTKFNDLSTNKGDIQSALAEIGISKCLRKIFKLQIGGKKIQRIKRWLTRAYSA
jgi:hypothetical protein